MAGGHAWSGWSQVADRTLPDGSRWRARARFCFVCGRQEGDPPPAGAPAYTARADAALAAVAAGGRGGYTEQTCWTISCDDCGNGWPEEYGLPHADTRTEADAMAVEAGWTLTGTTTQAQAWCRPCTNTRLCRAVGHTWTSWSDPAPRGLLGDVWVGRTRYCRVCSAVEWDPPLPQRAPAAGGGTR